MSDTKHESLMAIGKSAYESIVAMVAALECDYERLEELRDERADLSELLEDARQASQEAQKELEECPHENDEPSETLFGLRDKAIKTFDDARNSLDDWDEENAEELKELEEAAGDCEDQDEARERIQEDALSIQVRSDWANIGDALNASEFEIMLTTGGPAVRIMGELDGNAEPDRAWLEVQDWGTPWTQYFQADQDTLLTYCRCFYFGE